MLFAAQVLLDVTPRSLARPLDYAVPQSLADSVAIGAPVLVPLGSRPAVGYVVSVGEPQVTDGLRDIVDVLGDPLFDEARWNLASWIAREYACRPIDALRLFLPPGSSPKVAKREDGWRLKPPPTSPATERLVELLDPGYRPPAAAHRQRAIVAALVNGPLRVSELRAAIGPPDAALAALQKKGVVAIFEQRRWRSVSGGLAREDRRHTLTKAQAEAVEAIVKASPGSVVLLDGVTGSGKTEVYMQAVDAVLRQGRRAIVLVPEISLTPQTVGRFRARFGAQLAVLHSRLSDGERYDQWQLASSGEARVVIGARSALFAPVRDLGLVVIDEEHEPSYKQSSEPRYHARDVARELVRRQGAVLVLGSATPSLESLHASETGEVRRVVLPARATGAPMPAVTVVDMTQEFADGNRTMFSRPLAAALDDVIARRGKAVLFINRRGFASFVLCRECGFVPHCESCSVSLTYHEDRSSLVCHHCGHTEALPQRCPRCGSPYLRRFGTGTQRVEAEIVSRWPDVPVVRMDADTTARKGGHERVLAEFEQAPFGVLVGTQMIAKGLDYPDVELVGIVDADTGMHMPDFRATERTFQLLMQVSGRAGRAARPGRVVVQTYWPDHPAVRAVVSGDRSALVAGELAERRELGYPPFGRLARVLVASPSRSAALSAADEIASRLAASVPADWMLLGPTEPAIGRLKGLYRRHIVVKAPPGVPLGPTLWAALTDGAARTGVRLAIDVDPYEML
ncbi:primosomal protein N' [Coriobacteriia bacterium Es71-Z0120]|uniref:replication restart helicase PriA n=1 Tax=Parvivirga hydrogeniphila TaxID=2939460 RepID=UPI002260E1B7|nr:primosomal protein N' [Parvivirga hydrogeniphila]MCL4079536.1 primosomal protein N' [Parvivirga hydrogeniphila]